MIALIDSGNSRVKLGWLNTATGTREASPTALDGDDLARDIQHWLTTLPKRPARAVGVSVGAVTRTRQIEAVFAAHGCTVTWQQAEATTLGLSNGYAEPTQLGADRWVALLGLLTHLPPEHGPVMLASFGTATTIDTLSDTHRFVGGLILPGPVMMLEALAHRTAALPRLDANTATQIVAQTVAYPRNTQEAMASGVAAAQAGAVLRQWLLGLQHYGKAPTIIATGGGWTLVADEVHRILTDAACRDNLPTPQLQVLAHLVLDGLAALALTQSQAAPTLPLSAAS